MDFLLDYAASEFLEIVAATAPSGSVVPMMVGGLKLILLMLLLLYSDFLSAKSQTDSSLSELLKHSYPNKICFFLY